MSPIEDAQLRDLMAKVEAVSPRLADCWQATAIIESLGYTDHIITAEFGFSDALALGRYLYANHSPQPYSRPSRPSLNRKGRISREIKTFLTEFSRSFIYALPLLVVLLLGYLPVGKNPPWLPPDLAALLTLTTMASMITSGGFVQIISRRGQFYQQLGEPTYARRICLTLLKVGLLTNFGLSLVGTWFGFYRNLFADDYLILANLYYLVLSALWMLFAILSVFFTWGTMSALIGLASLFFVVRLGLGFGAMESQLVAMGLTLLAVAGVIAIDFSKYLNRRDTPEQSTVELPRLSAQVYILVPYFVYGVAYFSFIFLDRVIAGSALKPEMALLFAIDSEYQRSLDLALLVFLLLVPFVEYLSYIFIRYWYESQKILSVSRLLYLSKRLQRLYKTMLGTTVLLFSLLTTFITLVVVPMSWGSSEFSQIFLGSLSYLLFSIGLLNSIVLFSLNLPFKVLRCILPGLGANLCSGYLLANLLEANYAVYGLLIGSLVFMILSIQKMIYITRHPDYAYYLGGY